MNECAVPVFRHRQAEQAIARGQHQAAEQHRSPDVVAVAAAAGHGLAVESEAVECFACAVDARARRWPRPAPRRTRPPSRPCPNPARCPCRSSTSKPWRNPARGAATTARAPAVLPLASSGRSVTRAMDRSDAHGGLVDATHDGAIAGTGHAVAQDVEADRDVADAGVSHGLCAQRALGSGHGIDQLRSITAPPALRQCAGDRRKRPPPSLPARRQDPAPASGCRDNGAW